MLHARALVAAPLLLLALASSPAFAASTDTCAVLPFINVAAKQAGGEDSAESNVDWLGLSISETLHDALELRGLLSLSRDDVDEAYHRLSLNSRAALTEASVLKIGDTIDAEQVIYGEFEFHPAPVPRAPAAPAAAASPGATPPPVTPKPAASGSRGSITITAHVVDRRRMHQSPAFTESGALEDLASIEAHLAWQVLNTVAPQLAPPQSEFASLRPPVRLDAEENYIRGIMATNAEQREKFFLQSARLDSRFARPDFELGQLNYDRKQYRQAADWFQKIGSDDLQYHHAQFMLGLSLYQSGDYTGAQKAFQTIVDSVPLPEVYNDLAAAEDRRGLAQAVDDYRKAWNGDMNDIDYYFNLGYALWKKGDFDEAAQQFRAVLQREPDDDVATTLLGRCLNKQAFRPNTPADARFQGIDRLKTEYEERAYRQLKTLLDSTHASEPTSASPAPPPAPIPAARPGTVPDRGPGRH